MGNEEKRTQIAEIKPNTGRNQLIIDEYFSNGMQGTKAFKTVTGIEKDAKQKFNAIIRNPVNKAYIQAKQQELSEKADIKHAAIVRELLNYAFSDVTEFIELSPSEIKNLPAEVKRIIQSFEHKKHNYTDRNGIDHSEEIIRLKFIDKLKAIEMLNKHIGFYEIDNKQKAKTVTLNQFNVDTLNALYQALNPNEID